MSYTTFMRWHASFSAPLIETEWQITNLPFIEGQILLGNRWCQEDHNSRLRVGEAPIWAAARSQRGLKEIPVGLNGKHVCNEQWFATGEPWPTNLPDTVYGPDGWPLCCMAPTEEINGGSETGGAVVHTYTITHSPTGGSQTGGVVLHTFAITHAPVGGSETGGDVEHEYTITHAPAGGSETGGAVVHTYTITHATAGGSETGGAVTHTFTIEHTPTGGSETGGAVLHDFGFEHSPTGGSETGGAVTHDYTIMHSLAGGSETGGAVLHDFGFEHSPTGGSETGGAVTHDYAPPQPTPGSNCAGAATVNQSQTYSYNITAGIGVEQWFTFTLPSTGTWHIATTGLGVSGPFLTVYSNGSCPLPSTLSPTTLGPPRWVWNGTAGDVIRLKFTPALMGTASYTFVWDSGS